MGTEEQAGPLSIRSRLGWSTGILEPQLLLTGSPRLAMWSLHGVCHRASRGKGETVSRPSVVFTGRGPVVTFKGILLLHSTPFIWVPTQNSTRGHPALGANL